MLLESLAKQKGVDFELIVMDANSDDDTAGVVENFSRTSSFPVRFFQLDRPGLSTQRNVAVTHARFKQILFLDADVIIPTDFLSKSLDQIQLKNIQIAGTKIYAAESSLLFRCMYWTYSQTYLPVVRLWNPILHGCSIFVTRELHQKIGGFVTDITFEDFRYAADAAKFQRPKLLRKVYVKTSARRYYKFRIREVSELLLSGIRSIFKAGINGKKGMKRFHENYGKHDKPRY